MAAACTRPTITGEGASEVITQPAPAFWSQMPVLLARLATQSERKTEWRRGANAPRAGDMLRKMAEGIPPPEVWGRRR
jgi:hypothetical protein